LAECCFDTGGIGADISIEAVPAWPDPRITRAAALFGESASRVVVSIAPPEVTEVLERASAVGVPARIVGRTGGSAVRITVGGQLAIDLAVDEAERTWAGALERHFERRVA
jgi:phosphoribosylformylglycinamidine synthase